MNVYCNTVKLFICFIIRTIITVIANINYVFWAPLQMTGLCNEIRIVAKKRGLSVYSEKHIF